VRIARRPEEIHAVRLSAGGADLVIGCDLVVTAAFDSLSKIHRDRCHAIVNSHPTVTGDFTRNPDYRFPGRQLRHLIEDAAGPGAADFLDATRLATALSGDSIATNLFVLGYAWQKGLVPVSEAALMQAIELNRVAVESNKRAFRWGRAAAHDLAAVEAAAAPRHEDRAHHLSQNLEELVARRTRFLTDYQNAAYAARYGRLVERARQAEAEKASGLNGFANAVARYYFKLLAYKDEYEVARLYCDPTFRQALDEQFEGDFTLRLHLAPPFLPDRQPAIGPPAKRAFGPWVFSAFRLLAKLKGLRGTPFDPFGHTVERKRERRLIGDYETLIEELMAGLGHGNHALAVELAAIPEQIRGYGHIKTAHLTDAKAREAQLLEAWRRPETARTAAE
jgi:indolepyruvate ferredoxin oxidoreductase